MFVDLVGSTALSARLDPEDMREIIGAYHRCCAEQITKAGGFVAKYMGDGVLAYFGYPEAHEDDAERAVRSALALIEAVPKLQVGHDAVLKVRLGASTGLVVVGDLIGEGAAQEQGVVGDTPNLAARLQSLAEPGQVVVSQSTWRLTGGLFEYRDLGRVALKGLSALVQAWQVLGSSTVESRFEARHGAALTPLVGRDEELELLLRRWQQAKAGDGSVVLISGEPGIGKSRLIQTLMQRLGNEPHTRLRSFCSPHYQDTALHPTITQLERAAGFRRDDTDEQRLNKLEAVLAQATNDLGEAGPLLAALLSIATGGRYPSLDLTPQKRKEKTLLALVAQVEGLAARQPVLMMVEDAHWIDPTSLELLQLTVDRVPDLPVLLIITFRPEFTPPWIGRGHVTSLVLNRLSRRQRAEMIGRVTGGKALPQEIADQIVDRADGIPLFIEELTKSVVESGVVSDAGDRYTATGPLPAVAVPTTLQASLLARLDRLAPVREVAQIGAAIGRQFSHELISAVAPMPRRELDDALDQLVRAELIYRRGASPEAEYTFKHALVQDAAYGTLLRIRRQQLHARIAAALEGRFPEIVAAQPELLAHHSGEAGLVEPAIAYWRRAGERATERSANTEAVAHLNHGLKAIQRLPESRRRDELELSLQIALLAPHSASSGWASPEAGRVARRAVDLARRLGPDTAEECRALWAYSLFHMVGGETQTGAELGAQCLELAERIGDPSLLGYARWFMGNCMLWLGDLPMARSHLERGIAEYDPERAQADAARHSFDPGVSCRSFLGRVLWHLGFPNQGLACADDAIAAARAARQPFGITWALSWGAALYQLCGDAVRTEQAAHEDLDLATEQIIPFFGAHATILGGWAAVRQGQGETGLKKLREGIDAFRATGSAIELSHWLGLLAEACRDTGRPEEGLRVVGDALDHVHETGVVYYEPELHRLEGELRLRSDARDATAAESSFRRAIETASKQGAKSWELRAATSMARLWRDQGKRTEAQNLLAPIYGWFTEGFDTPDLKEAKALLDELVTS
jgi:class 3 adenylate cyclase/predicted ATPase